MRKQKAKLFLEGISVYPLRSTGRLLGVMQPTKQKKDKLIDDIISILCGELEPHNKDRRGNVKIGQGVYKYCELILDHLAAILGIEDSLLCSTIKSQHECYFRIKSATT